MRWHWRACNRVFQSLLWREGHGSIVSLRHPALSDEFEADSPDSPIARRRRPLISTWWAELMSTYVRNVVRCRSVCKTDIIPV